MRIIGDEPFDIDNIYRRS